MDQGREAIAFDELADVPASNVHCPLGSSSGHVIGNSSEVHGLQCASRLMNNEVCFVRGSSHHSISDVHKPHGTGKMLHAIDCI